MTAVVGVVGNPGLSIVAASVSFARGGQGGHGTCLAGVIDGEVGVGRHIGLVPVAALVSAVNQSSSDGRWSCLCPSIGDGSVLCLVAASIGIVCGPALGVSATRVARSSHGDAVGGHCGSRIAVVTQREGGSCDGRIASLVEMLVISFGIVSSDGSFSPLR